MHTTYLIGSLLEINHQTKALIHRGNKSEVALPTSGCFCLQALAERGGNTLSLTELMDIGWGHSGVEVTENSVRVMINKIRKAISSLGMQHDIILLTVPRSGYRLLVSNKRQLGLLPATGKNTDELTTSMSSIVDRGRCKQSVISSDMLSSRLKNMSGRMVVLGFRLLIMISIACTYWTIISNYNNKNDMPNGDWYFPMKETDTKTSHLFKVAEYSPSPGITLFRWISDNSLLVKLKHNFINMIIAYSLRDHAFYWMNFSGNPDLKGAEHPVVGSQFWTNSAYSGSEGALDIAISPSHLLGPDISNTGVAFSLWLELMEISSVGHIK